MAPNWSVPPGQCSRRPLLWMICPLPQTGFYPAKTRAEAVTFSSCGNADLPKPFHYETIIAGHYADDRVALVGAGGGKPDFQNQLPHFGQAWHSRDPDSERLDLCAHKFAAPRRPAVH